MVVFFSGSTSAHYNNNNNKFELHQPYTPIILGLDRGAMLFMGRTPMISVRGGIFISFIACGGNVLIPCGTWLVCIGLIWFLLRDLFFLILPISIPYLPTRESKIIEGES